MSSLNERNRKTMLIALALITLLLASVGFIAYYHQQVQIASMKLTEAAWQKLFLNATIRGLNATVQEVISTAPTVAFNLSYGSLISNMNVSSNTVTFLFGYVEASDLSELYYPSTLLLSFRVTHRTNGTAKVQYSYTTMQSVQLVKGITTVTSPFGIYPLTIMNARQGEVITFYITVRAVVYWDPVNTVIAAQNTTGIMQVRVGS